jgi:flagellar biosynthetic protein FliR
VSVERAFVSLIELSAGTVAGLVLVAARVLAAFLVVPAFGARFIPLPGRIGFGLLTAAVLAPVHPAGQRFPDPVALAGEVLVGLLLGFTVALVFAAVQMATALLDVQAGFGLAGVIDPTFGDQGAVLTRFSGALALAVFFAANGHHVFLLGLQALLVAVPPGSFPHLADRLTALSAALFPAALQIALPVVGALLLADVALGVLSRAAPALNLFAVGLPVKTALAIVAVGLAMPLLVFRLDALLRQVPASMVGLVR